MLEKIRKSLQLEEGATAVEYGIMVAAIAAIIVVVVFAIGQATKQGFNATCTGMNNEAISCTPDGGGGGGE